MRLDNCPISWAFAAPDLDNTAMAHEHSEDGDCAPHEHPARAGSAMPDRAFRGAVQLFKALGDEQRLRTLELLSRGEVCGSEIAATLDEPLSTVSHRMKLLEGGRAGAAQARRAARVLRACGRPRATTRA